MPAHRYDERYVKNVLQAARPGGATAVGLGAVMRRSGQSQAAMKPESNPAGSG
jgi:hypothetical protein